LLSSKPMNRVDAHRAAVHGDRGPWMVLAHGIGGRPRDWDPLVAAFKDDYRVVTFAQAGSADADPAAFSAGRHSSTLGFADDLGILCGELGVRDAVFVGHSMAGNAGVIASVGDPTLFSKLVLITASPCYGDDPATGYEGGFSTDQVDTLLGAMQSDYTSWATGFAPQAMHNPDRPALATDFFTVLRGLEPQVTMATFRAALTGDFRALYPRVPVPTLVVQTRDDVVVPVGVARWIAQAIPEATLVELPLTGHFPHMVDPGAIIAAIRPFLAA